MNSSRYMITDSPPVRLTAADTRGTVEVVKLATWRQELTVEHAGLVSTPVAGGRVSRPPVSGDHAVETLAGFVQRQGTGDALVVHVKPEEDGEALRVDVYPADQWPILRLVLSTSE